MATAALTHMMFMSPGFRTRTSLGFGLSAFILLWANPPVVRGQGFFLFSNRVAITAIDAPVFDALGAPLEGPEFLAQLFVAKPGEPLQPVGDAIQFSKLGYFNGGYVTVPYPAATWEDWREKQLEVQVRAWRVGAGATYAEAAQSMDPDPRGNYGYSNVFLAYPGGLNEPFLLPEHFVRLTSFRLVAVPEPSPLALGVMGAVLWLLRRRSG